MSINIGLEIEKALRARRFKQSDLAKAINTVPSNVKRMLSRKSIDTEQLLAISKALGVNFFRIYSNELKGKVDYFSLLQSPDIDTPQKVAEAEYNFLGDPDILLENCRKESEVLLEKYKMLQENLQDKNKYIALLEEKVKAKKL